MKKFIVAVLVIAVVSCAEKLIKKPEQLIPKKEMVNILYDLAILTAAKSARPAELIENNVVTMPYIYEKYSIDSIQFAESDLYYAADPTNYEDLFLQVQTRLDKEKAIIEDARKAKSDSIQKAAELQMKKRKAEKTKDSLVKTAEN